LVELYCTELAELRWGYGSLDGCIFSNSAKVITMKKLVALLLVIAFASRVTATAAPDSNSSSTVHRVTFAFHSAFLMNLHHFLYDMAVHKDKLSRVEWQVTPTPDEFGTLRQAVDFYRTNYASLGIREDSVMISIKHALSVEDTRRDVSGLGLPPALAAALGAIAPIYAKSLWPVHDKSNLKWITQVRALDTAYGAEIQTAIERHMGAQFPLMPIRVDVVFDTGSRQGAYTDEQTVIPSARVDYQNMASLEMLYHEASHTTVTAPLEEAISSRLKATGRNPDSDLWHVVQFYTVGAVTRDVLVRQGELGYQPYADKRGLYTGYWSPFMPVIDTVWLDHMAGKISLQQAAQQMVDRLPLQ
jgi:hypothetical protein